MKSHNEVYDAALEMRDPYKKKGGWKYRIYSWFHSNSIGIVTMQVEKNKYKNRLKRVEKQRDTYLKELNLYHANCECGIEDIMSMKVGTMDKDGEMFGDDDGFGLPTYDDGSLSKPD